MPSSLTGECFGTLFCLRFSRRFQIAAMSSSETSHFLVLLPAVVSRWQPFPAGRCEAVPEGLVKQDGWLSVPRAFPRSGRQLQLLTRCWSAPLSGLCRVRFQWNTDSEDRTRNIRALAKHMCRLWFLQHIAVCMYVCILYIDEPFTLISL